MLDEFLLADFGLDEEGEVLPKPVEVEDEETEEEDEVVKPAEADEELV